MNRLKNNLAIAAGLAVLIAVVGGISAGPAVAQAVKAALVKNVDERGRVPYSAVLTCATATDNCFANAAAVPAGKRLVIEHVSAFNQVTSPGEIALYRMLVGSSLRAGLTISTPITKSGFNNSVVNESVLAYVEAGEVVTIQISSVAPASTLSTTAYLSGYLVDLGI